MKPFLGLLLCFFQVGISVCVDDACLAYEWAYPLWHMANIRYQQASNSPIAFQMNKFQYRVNDFTQLTVPLCNADICSGQPTFLIGVNPAPIVAPNVDTVYGAAQLDLTGAAWLQLTIPAPSLLIPYTRYYSVSFIDMYTNVVQSFNAEEYPTGGTFCLSQSSGNCPGGTVPITLPRFSMMVIRIFSNGNQELLCGVQGCNLIKNIQLTIQQAPTSTLDAAAVYGQFMNASGCQYVYKAPICNGVNFNQFWNGVCQALLENPLPAGPEATYVNTRFSSLGITSTGCTSLNYAALNAALSSTNPTSGYNNVFNGAKTDSDVPLGNWLYWDYNGIWPADDSTNVHTRAIASWRLHLLNGNERAIYYTAFKTTAGETLNSAFCYKLVWQDTSPFVDSTYGFWSVTMYDNTYYLTGPGSLIDPKLYAVRGTGAASGTIFFKKSCFLVNNCILIAPTGLFTPSFDFNIMLRGYVPTSSFKPGGGYVLPRIEKINC